MTFFERMKAEGVSLGKIYNVLILFGLLVSCFLIYLTYTLSSTFQELSSATDQYIEMQQAAAELMDASDYLTEMVQRYVIDGNSAYLHNYFEEALENRRREDAIARMSVYPEVQDAIAQLRATMDESSKLTERDYYAMKLIVEATGMSPMPTALQDVVLLPEHAALPSFEKKAVAQHMVSDEEYYLQKDTIRSNMRDSLNRLEEKTRNVQMLSEEAVTAELRGTRLFTLIQVIAVLAVISLTRRLCIAPLLKAVKRIQEDSPIPIFGAKEFRYLASTYNRMFDAYKRSVASLNFKANHDELTKLYNRAGYALLLSRLDMQDVGILVMDVDYFKQVNDTCGHEVGDKVLQKVANVLQHNFRAEDYICRIGGDEFVAFIQHVNRSHCELIRKKFNRVCTELADTSDGLPAVSLSAGGAFGEEFSKTGELFELADKALYESKQNGRGRISFADGSSA